jgi:suppressor of fused protein SUFU
MTDEPDAWEDERLAALEKAFGRADDVVWHATVPFDFGPEAGGAADVVVFRGHVPGLLAVTSELIGRDDQVASTLGNYELAIAHRDDESWGPNLIAQLAHYTLESALEPGQTMDIGSATPAGSTIEALLFDDLARFEIGGRRCGVLLCIGITADELAECRAGRRPEIVRILRERGVHPYTDLRRRSVLPTKKSWWRRS